MSNNRTVGGAFKECLSLCRERISQGFVLVEYTVPEVVSSDFRNRLYDEMYLDGQLYGWVFMMRNDGFLSEKVIVDDEPHRKYVLKYTLK
jgi:hypothetical protein